MDNYFTYNLTNKNRSLPFWSWNGKLEEHLLKEQIDEMKAQGIGGFFIHARGGLETSYMEQEWNDCVRFCIRYAKEVGIEPWLYDECGWPSGISNGKVNTSYEMQMKYLLLVEYPEIKVNDQILFEYDKNYDLTKENPVYAIIIRVEENYLDILNHKAVAKFIETTYQEYHELMGEDKAVGFFTDEPQYGNPAVPYTMELESFILDGEKLLSLFIEKNCDQNFRFDFWQTINKLFVDSFNKQIYDWCDDNGYLFTGHMMHEDNLVTQMASTAGVMPFYEYFHIPGMDWIIGTMQPSSLIPKQLSSVAMQLGKKNIMTETFAASGGNVSFLKLKYLMEWQYIEGVNTMCQHLQSYTIKGARKRDYPPSLFTQQSWWGEYHHFNDYFSKLNYISQNTKPIANIGIIHPRKSSYLKYAFNERDAIVDYSIKFDNIIKVCNSFSEGSHLIDEDLLAKYGGVNDKSLRVGEMEYQTIILPNLLRIDDETAEFLQKAIENGVKVIQIGGAQDLLENKDLVQCHYTDEFDGLFDQLYPHINLNIKLNGRLGAIKTTRLRSMVADNGDIFHFLQNQLDADQEVDITIEDGKMLYLYDVESNKLSSIKTRVTLGAMNSIMLVESQNNYDITTNSLGFQELVLEDEFIVGKVSDNVVVLDTCELMYDDETISTTSYGAQKILLNEGYQEQFLLTYTFNVEKLVDICLAHEYDKDTKIFVNNHEVEYNSLGRFTDYFINKFDITPYVIVGHNEVKVMKKFHQNDHVWKYYGKPVHEVILNKMTFDTEIENIYLLGDFCLSNPNLEKHGVNSFKYGRNNIITQRPSTFKKDSLATQGYGFFNGVIELSQSVNVANNTNYKYDKRQIRASHIEMFVDGKKIENQELTNYFTFYNLEKTKVDITFKLYFGNRNLIGPFSSNIGEERFVSPWSFNGELLPYMVIDNSGFLN